MGESPSDPDRAWENLGSRWLGPLLALLIRTVHDAALAFDLATEALATARTEWDEPNAGEEALVALLGLGARILAAAAERGTVPAVERRRRHHHDAPHHLTIEKQRELARLVEQHLDLSPAAGAAADALARTAPSPPAIRAIRLSGLVDPEPLPAHEHGRHGDRAV